MVTLNKSNLDLKIEDASDIEPTPHVPEGKILNMEINFSNLHENISSLH